MAEVGWYEARSRLVANTGPRPYGRSGGQVLLVAVPVRAGLDLVVLPGGAARWLGLQARERLQQGTQDLLVFPTAALTSDRVATAVQCSFGDLAERCLH